MATNDDIETRPDLAALRADNDRLTQAFMKRCRALDVARRALGEIQFELGRCLGRAKPLGIASRALTDIAALTGSTAPTTGGREK